MVGFLIRKTFYDLWDNLFKFALLNLGFLVSLMMPLFLPSVLPDASLKLAVFIAGIIWCSIYLTVSSLCLKKISDYNSFSFSDIPKHFVEALPCGITAGVIVCLAAALLLFVIPFYMLLGNFAGLLLASLVFWLFFMLVLSFQFIFTVRARLTSNIYKIIKKCLVIFLDNPSFSIFSLIVCIIGAGLSVLTAFLFPGPMGIILFLDEALRLRLLKYDWLEAHPPVNGHKRPKIPWEELLAEEREKTGTRSLRNLIFPWKD